jgi:hypothetical protein
MYPRKWARKWKVQATSARHLTNSSSSSSQSLRVLMQIKWGSNAASGQTAEANAAGGQNSRIRIVRPRHHRRWDRVLVVHSSQQAAKGVVQVDDGAGDVLRVLVVKPRKSSRDYTADGRRPASKQKARN